MESLPLAPSEWPQDVQKRFQDTIPTIFGCKRAVFQKCLFSYGNPRFLRVGWPSCSVKIPFFRSEAATASHLDSKIQSDPWVTPLPHFTKNSKNPFSLFSLLSFLCSLPSALEAARGPSTRRHGQEKGWPPLAASIVFFLRPLLGSLLSSLFFLFSALFPLPS